MSTENKKKTYIMQLDSIKCPDGWHEMAHDLKWEQHEKNNPDLDEDELIDKFHDEVVAKMFEYGEYGSIEIEVDEDFNIVGGRIIPHKNE